MCLLPLSHEYGPLSDACGTKASCRPCSAHPIANAVRFGFAVCAYTKGWFIFTVWGGSASCISGYLTMKVNQQRICRDGESCLGQLPATQTLPRNLTALPRTCNASDERMREHEQFVNNCGSRHSFAFKPSETGLPDVRGYEVIGDRSREYLTRALYRGIVTLRAEYN